MMRTIDHHFSPVIAPRRVASRTARLVARIERQALQWSQCSEKEFQEQARRLQNEIKADQHPVNKLEQAFALTSAAVWRVRGIRLHPCQISAGIVLARGGVAEMATGEGKTLTATLPVALWGFTGRGMHVVTTNDYLAQRDANELAPIYRCLGLTVGCLQQPDEPETRRQAYSCDITYAKASEIGFDFLRDRMTLGPEFADIAALRYAQTISGPHTGLVQRALFAAMVDEADSVLIDDARTPLIIGIETPQDTAMISLYRWCLRKAAPLRWKEDFLLFADRRQALLTDTGAQRILLSDKPRFGQGLATETLLEQIERMLEALYFYHRDRQYTVRNGEVLLIDESTDRPLEGRKLQRGLHHCLEAKEGLSLSAGTKIGSQISVQTFFRRYRYLSGMTGTAWNARQEFRKMYRLQVTSIPTHRPCRRQLLPTRVFVNQLAKYAALTQIIQTLKKAGRPVLVGTPSIEASLQLSRLLIEQQLPHRVLNAFAEAEEAEIVAAAGQESQVTIATNMAGRGTDIKLTESVRGIGGLHVIATEMNVSSRVDRQLMGRAARQGDPGSYQLLLSLEDDLLRFVSPATKLRWSARARPNPQGELSPHWRAVFARVQRRIERQHSRDRRHLLKAEKQKRETYQRLGLCPFLEGPESG